MDSSLLVSRVLARLRRTMNLEALWLAKGGIGTLHKLSVLQISVGGCSTTSPLVGGRLISEWLAFLLPRPLFALSFLSFVPQRRYVPSQGSSICESCTLIFSNMEDGSLISASDAHRERLDGLVQGEETAPHGYSSTISLRIEVNVVYNLSDAFAD